MRVCEVQELGRIGWAAAYQKQRQLVEQRKRNEIPDQLLLVEHDPVVTLGRNSKPQNLLAPASILARAGIGLEEANRGGDVTYHGPGQLVVYPVLNLNDWKRDVHHYVRAIEECVIGALAEFGVAGERSAINSGVWVKQRQTGTLAKICAIGIHVSRWVTSHGFALNIDTDLSHFRYIVPCGLTQPVISLARLGVQASRAQVSDAVVRNFGSVFQLQMAVPETVGERIP